MMATPRGIRRNERAYQTTVLHHDIIDLYWGQKTRNFEWTFKVSVLYVRFGRINDTYDNGYFYIGFGRLSLQKDKRQCANDIFKYMG